MKLTRWIAGTTLAAVVLAGAAAASAQEKKIEKKDVPAAVLAAFQKAYPKATIKGYAKEVEKGQTVYEIESVEGKTTRDIIYSADGKALEIEEGIEVKDLPAAVKQALDKKFPKAQIVLVEKVTKGSFIGYAFTVTTADKKKAEVVFDLTGKEVKE
jgi:uncharacterized cupredoxin-like copper-binding protein